MTSPRKWQVSDPRYRRRGTCQGLLHQGEVWGCPGFINLIGIESPALTAYFRSQNMSKLIKIRYNFHKFNPFKVIEMKYKGFMKTKNYPGFLQFFLFFFSVSSLRPGNSPSKEFVPHVGQQVKDVVWVPTPNNLSTKC